MKQIRPYRPEDRPALEAIRQKNYEKWLPERQRFDFLSPDDPQVLAIAVVTDENDRPVASIGARRIAELGTVIDGERISGHELRHHLMPAFAKIGTYLYRSGYTTLFARVASPTPAWSRLLQHLAGFEKSPHEHFYFELEAALNRPKTT